MYLASSKVMASSYNLQSTMQIEIRKCCTDEQHFNIGNKLTFLLVRYIMLVNGLIPSFMSINNQPTPYNLLIVLFLLLKHTYYFNAQTEFIQKYFYFHIWFTPYLRIKEYNIVKYHTTIITNFIISYIWKWRCNSNIFVC